MTATTTVLNAEYLLLGSTVITTQAEKIELSFSRDTETTTNHASGGFEEAVMTVKKGTLALTLFATYTASGLDETLWNAFMADTPVAFTVKPVNATTSASNPAYSGYVLVTEHKPLTGAVNSVAKFDLSFPTTGTFSRATS